jgi:predicted ribosome quality control (RQC) complex YloA/Tae2 family protein
MKIIENKAQFPVMSYRDLEQWNPLLHTFLSGSRVERVFIPEAPVHPARFSKRTFVFDLSTRTGSQQLYVSLRAQECGVILYPAKTYKPKPEATRSAFDLSLSKCLSGKTITSITAIKGDRILKFEFNSATPFILYLHLIPGKPVGVLLEGAALLQSTDQRSEYSAPMERNLSVEQETKIPIHPEWYQTPEHYARLWQDAETRSHLGQRLGIALQGVNQDLHSVNHRLKSLQEQLEKTQKEEDWAHYGTLLQMNLYLKPKPQNGNYELLDPVTQQTIRVPAHPRMSIQEQLNHFFHLAKRAKKRLHESGARIDTLEKTKSVLLAAKSSLENASTESDLTSIEKSLGLDTTQSPALAKREHRRMADFTGRRYVSREGLTILAGRNLSENLELTFKIARGNDLWLHVKGRPGSHTVILLPPKRTASLETLLDAAHLCILHSGGKEWGKTEVDYTFRKNVKRIKNQTEVSYTQNKTLSITLEEERIKRLSAE